MSSEALWYFARGAGVVCLVLFSVTVALGIGARSGRAVFGLPRFAVAGVHRNASLIGLVLLVAHIATLLLDPYAKLDVVDWVVPFAGGYRPVWVGLGTVALDLMLAVVVTSLLRNRIGRRAWRAVHWAAYAAWPLAVLHGLGSGSDASAGWLRATVGVCCGLVAAAVIWRLTCRFTEPATARQRVARQPVEHRVPIGGVR